MVELDGFWPLQKLDDERMAFETVADLEPTLKREILLARNIQTRLLNGKKPVLPEGEISGVSNPARLVGGDYFDFLVLPGGKLRLIIGDVMGKGIPAAMLMILTRGAFRCAAESAETAGATVTAMDNAMYADLRALSSFTTVFCADWDPFGRLLTYANAGQTLPLVVRPDGGIEPLPKVGGIMLGGLPNQSYKVNTVKLGKEDVVFFFTDGIVEAQNRNKEQFGYDRLNEVLAHCSRFSATEIEQRVVEAVNVFTEGVPQKDDITMVVLKV